MLIARGCDVHALTKAGQTALHLAYGCGFAEIARLLIDGGDDVDIPNLDGRIALETAICRNQHEIGPLIEERGRL